MRLGLYQCPSPGGDLELGLNTIDEALGHASAAGVDMLTMPEVFLPGYNTDISPEPDGFADAMAAVPGVVARHGVGLTLGVAEYGEKTWNAAYAYDRSGAVIARYRKVQLWAERENTLYEPGDALTLFTFEGRKIGLLICYDVEFPEHTRALARAGAEAIVVPTANPNPYINVNEVAVPARALESGLTIVYANYTDDERDISYAGRSVIAGPDGRPLAMLNEETGLIFADMRGRDDPALETPFSTQFDDYRPITTIHTGSDQ